MGKTKNKKLIWTSFTVVRVITSHPDWDEEDGDEERDVETFWDKTKADRLANTLGGSCGGPCSRAYGHYVRTNKSSLRPFCAPV